MKKYLVTIIATAACAFGLVSGASAQSASFTFNDFVGTPNAGTYGPGQSFTFSVFLNFVPGGSVANLEGLSYWFTQSPGTGSFSITNRDFTGSLFTDPQTAGITYPQTLSPSNGSDLGASLVGGASPLGAGTYFIARITIAISTTATNGIYSIASSIIGGKTSVVADNQGNTFGIAQSTYQVTVAPDTGNTLLLLGVSFLGLVVVARRMQRAPAAVGLA